MAFSSFAEGTVTEVPEVSFTVTFWPLEKPVTTFGYAAVADLKSQPDKPSRPEAVRRLVDKALS